MRLEMDRKREQITQMCAPRTSACDYPQSGCDGDVPMQEEADTEDGCHGVGDAQENADDCDTGGNSSNGKNVHQICADKDNETEATERCTTSETNNSQSVALNKSQKPRKSCLKRVHSESKNGQDVTQFNSNDRGSCRDCGSTDVTEMLMAGAHFVDSTTPLEMEPIIPSQTKVVDCTNTAAGEVGSADNVDASSPQHSGDNTQPQQHFQQVPLVHILNKRVHLMLQNGKKTALAFTLRGIPTTAPHPYSACNLINHSKLRRPPRSHPCEQNDTHD